MTSTGEERTGQLQNFTIDQFAGSAALIIGSIGALLTIIWQSRCLCKCRIGLSDQCYLFDCSREPPKIDTEAEVESINVNVEENIDPLGAKVPYEPKRLSHEIEPEPEPEPIIP